ncbi:MAG: hypothetical protein QXJ06_00095 [Candidatus Aenigmatarchaeota archaeon]
MKGNSIITFILIMSLSMFFIVFISLTAYKLSVNFGKNLKDQASRQIALDLIKEIINLYQEGKKITTTPTNQSIELIEKKIKLPEKISGESYYIEAVSSTGIFNFVKINETFSQKYSTNKIGIVFEREKYYFDIPNIPIVIQGKAKPNEFIIKYIRYRFGDEFRDTIILGETTVLIDVEIVQ